MFGSSVEGCCTPRVPEALEGEVGGEIVERGILLIWYTMDIETVEDVGQVAFLAGGRVVVTKQ